MSKKFGVVIDDNTAEKVEEPLEYGDSRSSRIETLTSVGIEAEEMADRFNLQYDSDSDLRALTRQAFLAYANALNIDEQADQDEAEPAAD